MKVDSIFGKLSCTGINFWKETAEREFLCLREAYENSICTKLIPWHSMNVIQTCSQGGLRLARINFLRMFWIIPLCFGYYYDLLKQIIYNHALNYYNNIIMYLFYYIGSCHFYYNISYFRRAVGTNITIIIPQFEDIGKPCYYHVWYYTRGFRIKFT